MLQYQKIDVSERIDVNKTSASKECELCHYCFFKDIGFKFEEHVCNRCHDLLTKAYRLENIAILGTKGATFRCILWCINRNEGFRRLNSSVLEDKGVLQMNVSPNKTSFEIIKEGAFRGTYFTDIYSNVSKK